MNIPGLTIVVLACAVMASSGCEREYTPPLTVTNLTVVAPLPGNSTSVAYATLHNNSERSIAMNSISSPEFARVELHETSINNGVARMNRIDSLLIAAHEDVTLAQGGKHLMLLDPLQDRAADDHITLEIHYSAGHQDAEELLILQAPVTSRANFLP